MSAPRVAWVPIVVLSAAMASGCGRPEAAEPRPEAVVDFPKLYGANCSGCHGAEGRNGVAQRLNDPLYLAIAGDADLKRTISRGVPGTPMTAFAKEAGGTLTPAQVDALVAGLRREWGGRVEPPNPAVPLPAYAAPEGGTPGDAGRGREAYQTYCARCHGADGRGGTPGATGSIVDPAFLTLTSDQGLRTTVVAGHARDGMQGWRSYVPGHPMQPQEITDVVAWLASHRGAHD
jgi:mono/diheme cytochrome c family protein